MKETTFSPKSGTGLSSSVNSHSSQILKFVNLRYRFCTGVMPGADDILFIVLFFDIGDILWSINKTSS